MKLARVLFQSIPPQGAVPPIARRRTWIRLTVQIRHLVEDEGEES